jgi:hypothetical protein
MTRPNEIRKLAKQYNMDQVKGTRSHWHWKNRYTSKVVRTSCTPGDRNAIKNIKRDFIKADISNISIAA